MNYRVLRDCIIKGARAKSGDVISLDDRVAKEMMALGRVIPDAAMPKTSDRQVKEVESRETNSATTAKNKPRTSRGRSKSSAGNSKASS
jgi:hypothetical protein